jgi:hypothetical protein
MFVGVPRQKYNVFPEIVFKNKIALLDKDVFEQYYTKPGFERGEKVFKAVARYGLTQKPKLSRRIMKIQSLVPHRIFSASVRLAPHTHNGQCF